LLNEIKSFVSVHKMENKKENKIKNESFYREMAKKNPTNQRDG
jgi:hypothetical protein